MEHCQNCGAELVGEYCHVCGQEANEPRRAVIGLVQDVFVDTLAIDGKLMRTIFLLLWRPGRLARRYLDGKRVRYSPPFRLYLFASVFFFFAVFLYAGLERNWAKNGEDGELVSFGEELSDEEAAEAQRKIEEAEAKSRAALERAGVSPDFVPDTEGLIDKQESTADASEDTAGDATDSAHGDGKSTDDFNYSGPDWLEPYVRQLYEAGKRVNDDPRLFIAEMKDNLPRAMLLAPVFYGLLLLVLYIYRRRFYVYDHFVVSLYMHAALYAYLLSAIIIASLPVVGWLAFVPIVWGLFQPYAVFRQAYGSGWISTIIKGFISSTLYLIAVALIITLGLSYSLYQV